jgi:hypothetical protein
MGVDIYINCHHCGHQIFEVNYTHNIVHMMHAAAKTSHYDWADDFQGEPAWRLVPLLARLVSNLKKDPEKYRAMNPNNGWGDYDGMLDDYLGPLMEACNSNPSGILDFSV